ncbi:MAG: helix-turn-helix domain-containing protein [Microthrixaceae bacterium]
MTATRGAIREATLEIIRADSVAGVTFKKVAERAGVARATVYRHYATVEELVEDALISGDPPPVKLGGAEGIADQIVAALETLTRELEDPVARAIVTSVLDRSNQGGQSRDFRDSYVAGLIAQLDTALRVSLPEANFDSEWLFDHLVGPVFSRSVIRGVHPDAEFLRQVAARALTNLVDETKAEER